MESILVIKRSILDARSLVRDGITPLAGLGVTQIEFSDLVGRYAEFMPRPEMEVNPLYKQLIPYMVFMHEGNIFLMQRSVKAGEQRLAGKYTIGIGGHVRQADIGSHDLQTWGTREFCEEVSYVGDFEHVELLGLVNDDSNDVGRVHLGVVFVMHAKNNQIAVKSELASGVLVPREECLGMRDRMETWSQMVLDQIIARVSAVSTQNQISER